MNRFEKIAQVKFKGKSSIIAERILQSIRDGEYSVGSKMPPERIVAEQMGVSRPSVREAISALQIVGVLETRPGDGTYISKPLISETLSTQVQHILEQSDSPFEIIQARKIIESGVIHQAIKLATDADIENIRAVWHERQQKGLRGDYDAYTRQGRDFHLSIAKAAKNNLIIEIMDRLLSMTSQPLWRSMRCRFYEQNSNRIQPMIDVHRKIVGAFEERNAIKAIQALEEDLDSVLEQLYNIGV